MRPDDHEQDELAQSQLHTFIDESQALAISFVEGQRLIRDLAILHELARGAFAWFRDVVLTVQPLIALIKRGEQIGFYIDSEEPFFRLKMSVRLREAQILSEVRQVEPADDASQERAEAVPLEDLIVLAVGAQEHALLAAREHPVGLPQGQDTLAQRDLEEGSRIVVTPQSARGCGDLRRDESACGGLQERVVRVHLATLLSIHCCHVGL